MNNIPDDKDNILDWDDNDYEDLISSNISIPNPLQAKNYREVLPKVITNNTSDDKLKDNNDDNDNSIKLLILNCQSSFQNFKNDGKQANNNSTQKRFNKEEDTILKYFIQQYKIIRNLEDNQINKLIWDKNDKEYNSFWSAIYQVIPDRTHSSVNKHLKRLFNSFEKRGQWSKEDDNRLMYLCKDTNLVGKWSKVGQLMNRMPEDCRDRWRNYLTCEGKQLMNKWSSEEELRLRKIIENQNYRIINWAQVSEMMGKTRSRIQCRYKWNKILKNDAKLKISHMTKNQLLKLFQIVKQFQSYSDIDWNLIVDEMDTKWTSFELQLCFETWYKKVKDYKSKSVNELATELIKLVE